MYISCKGPISDDYSYRDTEDISTEGALLKHIEESVPRGYIWIRTGWHRAETESDLDIFAKNLDKLENPVVLYTCDGDRDVPSSYNRTTVEKLLNSDKILKWLTQNYDKTVIDPKLGYLPIGFNVHPADEARWSVVLGDFKRISRKNRILSDTHFSFSHHEREILYEKLKNFREKIDFIEKRETFERITELYHSYRFVLSPRGRGIDCYRTWEAFMAGCVVITQKSSLDGIYLENDLPVVLIENWEDVLDLNLDQIWKDREHLLENVKEKLKFKYWLSE